MNRFSRNSVAEQVASRRADMKLLLEIPILALLPLAAIGTDSRPYGANQHLHSPYQPPRTQYPTPQREDYYPPLAQHPQPSLSCCRSNFPGKI